MDTFTTEAAFPPSLANQPGMTMLTVMSGWVLILIALNWLYETIDGGRDHPAPKHSYVAAIRRMRMWVVGAAFVLTAPRLAQVMLWQVMSPGWREGVAVAAWVSLIPACIMVLYAWWNDRAAVRTENAYTDRHGFYAVEQPAPGEKTRGMIVLVLVFAIAFATTFVRPRPHVDAPAPASIERG